MEDKSAKRTATVSKAVSATQQQIASDRQMAMRIQTHEITGLLAEHGAKSLVKGSAAMLMHGANVQPGDVDLYVDHIPKARRALTQAGYVAPGFGQGKYQDPRGLLPDIDVLHGPDWGVMDIDKSTQNISGVPVRTRADLIKDIQKDDRPEKQTRNKSVLKHLM